MGVDPSRMLEGFWRDLMTTLGESMFFMITESKPLCFQVTPEMESYVAASIGCVSTPMKYLYSSSDIADLQEIITNLTFVRLMQDEAVIIPEDDVQVARVNDAGTWMPMMADYVSFVCMANPNFSESCFDMLMNESAAYYKAHIKALMDDFAMDMEGWKKGFAGSLFIQ